MIFVQVVGYLLVLFSVAIGVARVIYRGCNQDLAVELIEVDMGDQIVSSKGLVVLCSECCILTVSSLV